MFVLRRCHHADQVCTNFSTLTKVITCSKRKTPSCSLAVFRLADTIRNMQATGQSGNRWESGHEFISWENWAEVSSWTHRLVWQEARYPHYGGQ